MKKVIISILAIIALIFFSFAGYYGYHIYKLFYPTLDITDYLFDAVKQDNVAEAKRLIEQGADVNGIRGQVSPKTPLTAAVYEGSPEMVAMLLEKGAHVEKPLDYLKQPLDSSISIALGREGTFSSAPRVPWKTVRENQKYIIPLLMKANAPYKQYPEIIPAILSGNLELVKKLKEEAKLAIKTGSTNAYNILRAAIFSNNKEMISFVFKNILDFAPTMKTSKPLQLAIESGNEEIIDYILTLPITDINASDDLGSTPLHAAVMYPIEEHGNIKTVEKLLKLGAQTDAVNKQGKTPVELAIDWGNRNEMVQLLLSHGIQKVRGIIENIQEKVAAKIERAEKAKTATG